MENQMQTLEPAAKVLAATALSQSLSFCTERKYLEKIGDKSLNDIFSLEAIPGTLREEVPYFLFCQRQQRQAARGERTSGKREDQPETSAQTDRRKFAEKIYHGRMLPPYSR